MLTIDGFKYYRVIIDIIINYKRTRNYREHKLHVDGISYIFTNKLCITWFIDEVRHYYGTVYNFFNVMSELFIM